MARLFLVAAAGLVAAALLCPAAARAGVTQYHANLLETSTYGVSGSVQLSLDDAADSLTVSLRATGLEPGKIHPAHIHGFVNGKDAVTPTVPAFDFNHNGMIEDYEGELAIGPIILP